MAPFRFSAKVEHCYDRRNAYVYCNGSHVATPFQMSIRSPALIRAGKSLSLPEREPIRAIMHFNHPGRRSRGAPWTAGLAYTYSHHWTTPLIAAIRFWFSYNLGKNWAEFDVAATLVKTSATCTRSELCAVVRDAAVEPLNARRRWSSTTTAKRCSRVVNEIFGGWEISGVTLFQGGHSVHCNNRRWQHGISLNRLMWSLQWARGTAASYPTRAWIAGTP